MIRTALAKACLTFFGLFLSVFVYAQNQALDLSGLGNEVNVTYNLNAGSGFTVEQWFYIPTAITEITSLVNQTNGNTARPMDAYVTTSGEISLWIGDDISSQEVKTAINTIVPNTWYHIAIVYDPADPTDKGRLYVNGVPATTTPANSNYLVGTVSNDGLVRIGRRADGTEGDNLYVDELRIWSIARDGGSIGSDYDQELVGNEANLDVYLRFEGDLNDAAFLNLSQNGSLVAGSIGYVPGAPIQENNYALDFDGVDDHVQGSGIDLTTGDFTIEAWYNTNDPSANQTIFSVGSVGASNQSFHISLENTTVKIGFFSDDIIIPYAVATGWHHLAVSHNATTLESRLYIDGAFIGSGTHAANFTGDTNFEIGQNGWSATGYFNGQIDELRVWNTIRSQSQIAAFKDEELNPLNPGLMAYFDFSDGPNTSTLSDLKGGGPGLLINMDIQNDWVPATHGLSPAGPLDTTNPTITITSAESDPTAANPIPVTITFNEEVVGFELSDIFVSNGSASNLNTSDSITFTVDISPSLTGQVLVDVTSAVVTDLTGNFNDPSPTFSITYDNVGPVITASSLSVDRSKIYVEFDEPVYGAADGTTPVDIGDFDLTTTGGTATVTLNTLTVLSLSEIELGITINGVPDGNELTVIDPFATSVYDVNGNVMSTSQTNNSVRLGDNGVLSFDGQSNYVSIPDDPVFQLQQYTLEAWVNFSSSPATNEFYTIISKGTLNSDGGATLNGYNLSYGDNGGTVGIFLGQQSSSGTEFFQHAVVLTPGTWYHIAGSYDGTTMRIFLDGVEVEQFTSLSAFDVVHTGSFQDLKIGVWEANTNGDFLKGKIDEVRIWNYARDGANINALRDESISESLSGLVAYYDFEDSVGASLSDKVALRDGTLNSFDQIGAAGNWASGGPILMPIDNVAPTLTFNEDGITIPSTIITGGVDDNDAMLEVSLDGGTTRTPATNNGDGSWTYDMSVDPNYIGEGLYNINIYGRDFAENEGTTSGSVTVDIQYALYFDGVDDYVMIPDAPALDITGDLTLETWVQFTQSIDETTVLISKWNPDAPDQRSYLLQVTGTDTIQFIVSQDGTTGALGANFSAVQVPFNFQVGKWYHVAATYVPSTDMSVYVNGELIGSENGSIVSVIHSGTSSVVLGSYGNYTEVGTGLVSTGEAMYLDETRIWSKAKTQQDIQNDMFSSVVGSVTNLNASYTYDYNSGTTLPDDGSLGNSGSLNDNNDGIADGSSAGPIWSVSTVYDADVVAPFYVPGYPSITNITPFGFDITVQLNEPGTYYYVVVPNGSPAPSVDDVRSGTGGTGQLDAGSIAVTAPFNDFVLTASGLSSSTNYDVYIVAQDDEGTPNVQFGNTFLNVTTLSPFFEDFEDEDLTLANYSEPLNLSSGEWQANNINATASNISLPPGMGNYIDLPELENVQNFSFTYDQDGAGGIATDVLYSTDGGSSFTFLASLNTNPTGPTLFSHDFGVPITAIIRIENTSTAPQSTILDDFTADGTPMVNTFIFKEDFDFGLPPTPTLDSAFLAGGYWLLKGVNASTSTNAFGGGGFAAQINPASGNFLQTPQLTNADSIAFWYKGTPGDFYQVWASDDGGVSFTHDLGIISPTATYQKYYFDLTTIFDPSLTGYVKIEYVSGSGALLVDAFESNAEITPIDVTLNALSIPTTNLPAGSVNNVIHAFSITPASDLRIIGHILTLDTLGTSFAATDFPPTPFKVWYNTVNDFSTATQLGSFDFGNVIPGGDTVASNMVVLLFDRTIMADSTGYIYTTLDVSSGATIGNTISTLVLRNDDIGIIQPANIQSGNAGGGDTFTIVASLPPDATIQTLPLAGDTLLNAGSTNNLVYKFSVGASGGDITLQGMALGIGGDVSPGDFKNNGWKLYSSINTDLADPTTGTFEGATNIGQVYQDTVGFALSNTITDGNTLYFYLLADIDSLTQGGKTFQVGLTAPDPLESFGVADPKNKINGGLSNSATYVIQDTLAPVVSAVPSTSIISDTTSNFYLDWVFNEPMDTLSTPPTVSFADTTVLSSLSSLSTKWLNDSTYRVSYSITDNNVHIDSIDVNIQGGQDMGGNILPLTNIVDLFSIDTRNPVITIDVLSTSVTSPQLTGTIDDNSATIDVTVAGNTYAATNNGDGTWTLNAGLITPALADGTYDVSVQATDVVGNVGSDTTTNELTINLQMPVPVISTLSPDPTNDNPIAIEIDFGEIVTGFDSSDLQVSNANASNFVDVDGQTYTVDLIPLTDGVITVDIAAAAAQDQLGGDNIAATTFSIQYDGTAPMVTVDVKGTSITSPQLSGTIDDNSATIAVTVAGNTYTATNNGDGTWTLPASLIAPPLADGTYDVNAQATDAAGNVGSDATTDELIISQTVVAIQATNHTSTSFQANWSEGLDVQKYQVDISDRSDFGTFLTGFENFETTATNVVVSGLNFSTTYYYRVRAVNTAGEVSANSNVFSTKTLIDAETVADSLALVQIYQAVSPVGLNWESERMRNWDGVSLNATKTRVSVVDIKSTTALGEMPNPFAPETDPIFGSLDMSQALSALTTMDVSNNAISGLMDFSGTSISNLNVSGNALTFGDLEPLMGITTLDYSNQANIQFEEDVNGQPILIPHLDDTGLRVVTDGSANSFMWYRNGTPIANGVDYTITDGDLFITDIDYENMGYFRVDITNSIVTGLTLSVDSLAVFATADIVMNLKDADGNILTSEVFDGALLETVRRSAGYDTLYNVTNVAGTFEFQDVILGDYLCGIDPENKEQLIPTYFGDAFQWEEATVVEIRANDQLDIKMTQIPPALGPGDGDGTMDVLIEEDFGDTGGRIDARRRAAKRKCGLRRRTRSGRTEQDEYELIAYGETDENGEFKFGFLPQGTYKFFVEYPGIPLDENAEVEFVVGEAGISDTDFKLQAFATENGIEVTIEEVLGVILDYFKDLSIYPNPSHEHLNIRYRHLKSSDVTAQLVDLAGNVKWSMEMRYGYDGDLKIDVSDFKEGIYILRFYDRQSPKDNVVSYRIMVRD